MITYTIQELDRPFCCIPGDTFRLTIDNKVVYNAEIITKSLLTHWMIVNIPGVAAVYFIGNDEIIKHVQTWFPGAREVGQMYIDLTPDP